MRRSGSDRVLAALYGPTSAGKTALAVDVALRIERELGRKVVVISADSRQVYRYMDIGTSKTTVAQMRGIRHELIDVTEPVRKFELEDYVRLAREKIASAFSANSMPFIVGGTGVYVSALLGGWQVAEVGAARAALRRDFPRSMAGDAYAMLRRLNRDVAARVHPGNYEAVINALAAQVADSRTGAAGVGQDAVVLGVDPGARAVDRRVEATYADQVKHGLFGEIAGLNARYDLDDQLRRHGKDSANQVLHTHGYREFFELAADRGKPVGNLTDAERATAGDLAVEHIRRHTRRQRGWFGKLNVTSLVTSAGQAYSILAKSLGSG